jgi:alkanesulfonate monooxygenase SsuD/methylene tetrahydromethanopterin reductase-like flavin-dependent oxidoreductase (luciferase family)
MQFGILDSDTDPRAVVDRAVRAEELGFASFFVGHHRFTPGFGQTQHPWIVLSAIAARTERIRLGTSIFLLPLSHPLEVAEQVASLDVLSRGRVILGVGLGYRPYEFEALGLTYGRRGELMSECLEVVRGAWEHESCSHDGFGTDTFIAGTPDDCSAGLRRAIDETGCDHVLVYTGGPPSLEAMEMFSREVMSAFA